MQALARRFAAPVFALAMFSSAALIFTLQPLFARMVTPLLGGSPAVWNTSMVFFQAALLLGYIYAHVLTRLKDLRLQAAIHVVVLLLAWFVLPVHVSTALGEPDTHRPILWLLGVLAVSVGAPFAAASATAPLLQAWFARTGREDASDPYYLYAASNLGSFVGLLAYPILIEPLLGAHAQSQAWTTGYGIVALLILVAGATAIGAKGDRPKALPHLDSAPTWKTRFYWMAAAAAPSALTLGVTLHISTDIASAPMLWVIPLALYLATFVIAFARGSEKFAPSAFFLHPIALAILIMSYYLSSGLWLLSMGGILLGFFLSALVCHLALAQRRPSADRLTEFFLFVSLGGVLGGAFAALLAPIIFNNVYEYPIALAAACLFRPLRVESTRARLLDASVGAAVMLAVLALLMSKLAALEATLLTGAIGAALAIVAAGFGDERRPPVARYTFFAVSLVLAAILTWLAFNETNAAYFQHSIEDNQPHTSLQQPWGTIVLVLSFLLLTFCVHATSQRRHAGDAVIADLAAGAAVPVAALLVMLPILGSRLDAAVITVMALALCGIGIVLNSGRPALMTGIVLVAFLSIFLKEFRGAPILDQERTFFGVLRTRVYVNDDGVPPERVLLHGTTLHGAQVVDPRYTRAPLTYYYPDTSLGEAIATGARVHSSANVALIGLGTGSTACLLRPQDHLTIFEIDPAVVALSGVHGTQFTFVQQCQPNAQVALGDARLEIAHARDNSFNVIVVDAFSSDAIPAHLLTREAIALYLRKATPDGIVILHLSNRNLALVSEAARVARDLNVPTLYRLSDPIDLAWAQPYSGSAASTMIIARDPRTLTSLPFRFVWRVVKAPDGRGWSDDYINLPRALWDGAIMHKEECLLYPDIPRCSGHTATQVYQASPPPAQPTPLHGQQNPSAPSSSPSH